jgi:hypothetical protein
MLQLLLLLLLNSLHALLLVDQILLNLLMIGERPDIVFLQKGLNVRKK